MTAPALTAEERAAKLWGQLLGSYESFTGSWEKAIASAIREAEEAAYDRAMSAVSDRWSSVTGIILGSIRNLKSAKPITGFDENAPLPSDRIAEPFLLKPQKETP